MSTWDDEEPDPFDTGGPDPLLLPGEAIWGVVLAMAIFGFIYVGFWAGWW